LGLYIFSFEKGALKTAKVLFETGRNVKIAFPPRLDDEDKVDLDDCLTEHEIVQKQ